MVIHFFRLASFFVYFLCLQWGYFLYILSNSWQLEIWCDNDFHISTSFSGLLSQFCVQKKRWFPIGFIHSARILQPFLLDNGLSFRLMFLTKCRGSYLWFMSGLYSRNHFDIGLLRSVATVLTPYSSLSSWYVHSLNPKVLNLYFRGL